VNVFKKNDDAEIDMRSRTYTGGLLLPETSEFKNVLKKHKSRLSTLAPNVLDLDCGAANASYLNHLIGKNNTT